jgi:hypothetical protein
MDPRRRELFHRALDGFPPLMHLLWHFDNLRRCDDVLQWLIAHGYTGKNLWLWMRSEHEGSILKTCAFVLQKLEKEKAPRPLIIGSDYFIR